MLRPVATRIKDAAPIVIPKLRQMLGIRKRRRNLKHFLNGAVKVLRDWHVVELCENPRMEEKVQGIGVVIHGLLKVRSILPHLALRFLLDYLPSTRLPTRSCRKPRAHKPDEKQADALTQKMRVRGEIGGKKSLNVTRVHCQGMPKVSGESLGKSRTIFKQMPNP